MDALTANMPLIVFVMIGTVAVASSILVVAMRNPVHSALFLLLTFMCVAVLFVMQRAEFVGAVQVLVYAGGIMVLFLFVVMLINYRELPEERVLSNFWKGGLLVGVAVFALFVGYVRPGVYHDEAANKGRLSTVRDRVPVPSTKHPGRVGFKRQTRRNVNAEAVAQALYSDYLVPFEVASLFLLVAMVGAIVIGKRELQATEEDTAPDYILERIETERRIKEAMGA